MSSKDKMYALVKQYLQSGLSISAFCKANNLSASTFRYWMQQYNNRGKSVKTNSFIIIETTPSVSAFLEILYPNKVSIRVASGTDLSFLRELINLY